MVKHIHFTVDEDEFEWLERMKNEHGLTWRGMVVHAAKSIGEESN